MSTSVTQSPEPTRMIAPPRTDVVARAELPPSADLPSSADMASGATVTGKPPGSGCKRTEAFEFFVAEHREKVRSLVFRLLNWKDGCDDVVQDVFLAAWKSWSKKPKNDEEIFWLKRIAINQCRSRQRRNALRTRWLAWLRREKPAATTCLVSDPLLNDERARRVRRAIETLGPAYREVTVLFYFEHMTVDAIAELTGQRRNNIEVRLHRARRQLETLLSDLMH